jgi:hypothetical protein
MSIKPFTDTLNAVRYGELVAELDAAWNQLVNKVRDTGKKGSLTIKLDLTPGKGMAMEIDDHMSVKEPKFPKGSTLLFPTVEGNLQRTDPNQRTLELRSVDMSTGEIKDVDFSGRVASVN